MAGAGDEIFELVVLGDAQAGGGPVRPAVRGMLWDLASLTKVVATTSCILLLADDGAVGLDDRVQLYLPEVSGQGRELMTIRHLLAHTSGLPAEIKFWQQGAPAPELRRQVHTAPLESRPGSRARYSDVGFMLLGDIVEVVSGLTLDQVVEDKVTGPLGMRATGFNPGPQAGAGAGATEIGPDGRALVGVVHDENARFFGGIMGHAGLFSTIDDLAVYAQAWVGRSRPVSFAPWAEEVSACQTEGLGGRRGLGWALRGDNSDFLGGTWPASTLCHTGFTGTSMAVDPKSGYWAVLLTNDVHFGRGRGRIGPLRTAVYSAVGPLARAGARSAPGAGRPVRVP